MDCVVIVAYEIEVLIVTMVSGVKVDVSEAAVELVTEDSLDDDVDDGGIDEARKLIT